MAELSPVGQSQGTIVPEVGLDLGKLCVCAHDTPYLLPLPTKRSLLSDQVKVVI